MNNTLRKEWIAALRSGDYKQTTGWLQKAGGFCCLGIACEVYMKNFPDRVETLADLSYHTVGYSFDALPFVSASLPTGIDLEFGLDTLEARKLMNMNDIEKLSFNEIADYLESKDEEV